jgi:hypothetical protein
LYTSLSFKVPISFVGTFGIRHHEQTTPKTYKCHYRLKHHCRRQLVMSCSEQISNHETGKKWTKIIHNHNIFVDK